MKIEDIAVVKREVTVHLIPFGEEVDLMPGTEVLIVQQLGGSFTMNINGNLVRLAGKDADAIGKEPLEEVERDTTVTGDLVTEDELWAKLRTCYDPEIPVNIVDLGLIYNLSLTERVEGGYDVGVHMTLTAPGCGMGPVLVADIEDKLYAVSNVIRVDVVLVFDPPWSQEMMSDSAKLELGML